MKSFALILVSALLGTSSLRAQDSGAARPPGISLFEAVKLVEAYVAKHPQPQRPLFLSSVRYLAPGTGGHPFGQDSCWEVAYGEVQPTPSGLGTYFVSMSREVKFVGGD